jgi:hypothetical protein
MKEAVETYLNLKYKETKWRFISLTHLIHEFGQEVKQALKELKEEGKITHREGANSWIVELLNVE